MTYVNLIELVHQVKNLVEVVASVETSEGKKYLGIADFFLMSTETLPEDEDELCYYLEDKDLVWDLYIPHYDEVSVTA